MSLSARNASLELGALDELLANPALACLRAHLESLDLSENRFVPRRPERGHDTRADGLEGAHETAHRKRDSGGGLVLGALLGALPALETLVLDDADVESVVLRADSVEKELKRETETDELSALRGLSLRGNPIAQLHADVLLLPSLVALELDGSRHLRIAGLESLVTAGGGALNESYWTERLEWSRNRRYKRYLQALESPEYDAKRDAFHLRVSLAHADVSALVEQLAALLAPLSRPELTRVDRVASLLDFLQVDSSGAVMACERLERLVPQLLSRAQRFQHLHAAIEWLPRLRCGDHPSGHRADVNPSVFTARPLHTGLQSELTAFPVVISQMSRNRDRSESRCSGPVPETCRCSLIGAHSRKHTLLLNCSHSAAAQLRDPIQFGAWPGADETRMDLSHSRLRAFPSLESSTFATLVEIDVRHTSADLALSLLRALETRAASGAQLSRTVAAAAARESPARPRVLAYGVPLECAAIARFKRVARLFADGPLDAACEEPSHSLSITSAFVGTSAPQPAIARSDAASDLTPDSGAADADGDEEDAVLLLLFGSHSAARLRLRHLAFALLVCAFVITLFVALLLFVFLLRRASLRRKKRRPAATAAAISGRVEHIDFSCEPEPPADSEPRATRSPRNSLISGLPLCGDVSPPIAELLALGLLPEAEAGAGDGLRQPTGMLAGGYGCGSRSLVLPRRLRPDAAWTSELDCEQCAFERLSRGTSCDPTHCGGELLPPAAAAAARAGASYHLCVQDWPSVCQYQCGCARWSPGPRFSVSGCGPPLSPVRTPERVSSRSAQTAPSPKHVAVTHSPRKGFLTTFV